MVFPRINNGLRVTLVYYDIKHISSAVGVLSGKFNLAKMVDENGKELPPWDNIVFLLHAQLEDEIQQIINLNYPHVRNMILEDLREFIETPAIKSVQKDRITKLLLDFNASEEERILTKHPNGFSLGADPAFLPQYFIVVENALNNLKRIINKYLNLYDTGNLPIYQPISYLPPTTLPVIKDGSNKKLSVKFSVPQLVCLFKAMREQGLINDESNADLTRFLSANFSTTQAETISEKSMANAFASTEKAAKDYWLDQIKQLRITISNLQ